MNTNENNEPKKSPPAGRAGLLDSIEKKDLSDGYAVA